MNNKHILELTLRLSQSLDQNYDVVSMDTVLSVISALEGTTITKEQLEATRLAKYINHLRRRTKCENLARRAKSLLKKWREMVGIQQSSESSAGATSNVVTVPASSAFNSSTVGTSYNMPVTDNAVSTSHLPNLIPHQQRQTPYQTSVKLQQQIQQPYHSQPSSPINLQERSNPNEFLISMSTPASGSQIPKISNTNVRKKNRLENNPNVEAEQQQPTSFANLLTGLGNTFTSTRKAPREKSEAAPSSVKPVETFIIEHSSNSNSDLICLPANNTASSNFTSANNVPPVVIDLQDTNSSMNSLVSKDVTNASSTFYKTKSSAKKSKKEKKRKDRNLMTLQNQPLQDCDDQNTTTASYNQKRSSNLLLDEKSHSACPTISNISEILSLSNSSMSSVFPSTDAMSKNIFQSGYNELTSPAAKVSTSDLTFAGKFKQNTTSTLGGCNILNYSTNSENINVLSNDSSNQNKFSLFGGVSIITNSNDSTSNSQTSQFNAIEALKADASNSKHNMDEILLTNIIKHDINEKSMSNMSNKGNSSTENTFAVGTSNITSTQQQSIDLTAMNYSSEQNVKQPKKRGRKKGSKGVDSVIAKETSLSSQMLISSLSVAGKKVKTTKELYAEMENRKMRNVKAITFGDTANNSRNLNVQQQQKKPENSRRASFFSDIAESDSCTMTSEPSRDSGNVLNKALGKRETTVDNNSNYSKNDSDLKIMCDDASNGTAADPNSSYAITSKIKSDIQEILKLLTPPPSVKEIEDECFNNITPCTCTVEEVITSTENDIVEITVDTNSTDSNFNTKNSTNVHEKENNDLQIEQMTDENVKESEKSQKDQVQQPTSPAKVKKSIFDLDFDDDEDPLNSIIADIAGKKLKTETNEETNLPVVEEKTDIPQNTGDDLLKVDPQDTLYALNVPTNIADNIVLTSYEVKYDENCKAKNRFEIQTQKITQFHIDTLHNCFIPNVNGNWNHADFIRSAHGSTNIKSENDSDGNSTGYCLTDGYDVVPLYGSDMNEQIVKDLSHVPFTKKFKVKNLIYKNEILFHIPFLGVSRMPDIPDSKLPIKDIKKLELDEEKENVLLTSVLDTRLINENDECGAKDIEKVHDDDDNLKKNIKINVKRIKRHIKVKESATKRLKITVDRNTESSPTNSLNLNQTSSDSDSDCTEDPNYIPDSENKNISLYNKLEDKYDSVNDYDNDNNYTLSSSDDQNNRILSEKKPSSKINSPLNSLPSVLKNENVEFDQKENNSYDLRQKRFRKRIQRKKRFISCKRKMHKTLFYHDEICTMVQNGIKEHIFQISSCSSGCSADEDETRENRRYRTVSSSSASSFRSECSDNKYDGHMLNLQQYIIKSELEKRTININENKEVDNDSAIKNSTSNSEDDLLEENNRMLLSFNNIYKNFPRDENKDHENNMLKQQLYNCDDYNNLNNNFNLIKYIDNKTSSVNNINNSSCSNNYSDTNIIISSSSCNNENPTNSSAFIKDNNLNNSNDNANVQIKPFKEYRTGIRAVDEDVNDDDGNNCGRLQQFKEWHEVLQLHSYNDELLTVLPYVVLE
ncbi:mediator complex subunit 26 [Cochliomyia hominivorax]